MTALAGGVSHPSAQFRVTGDSVSGRVADFNDLQVTDFNSKAPKFWSDGNPMMQTRVTLELDSGDKVSLFVKPGRMTKAVREAIKAAGAKDIDEDGRLTVTFTGEEPGKGGQPAKCFTAVYEPYEPPL